MIITPDIIQFNNTVLDEHNEKQQIMEVNGNNFNRDVAYKLNNVNKRKLFHSIILIG